MASIPFIILDSLVYASWLFMVASGLTLIYGVMKVLNVAHGSLYAFGAYANAWLVGWYFNNYTEFEVLSFLFIPTSALVIGIILGEYILGSMWNIVSMVLNIPTYQFTVG